MKIHTVRVQQPGQRIPRQEELAYRIARVAATAPANGQSATAMVANRIIENAACAIAAINRKPVANARTQALAFPRPDGATMLGMPADSRVDCTWAAYANATAVRELDFHDSFFADESCHPGDTISALIAVAQQKGATGEDLVRGILTAYEIQIDLAKAVSLYKHRIDHVAHLGPAIAAGISAMLRLDVDVAYQAIGLAAYLSCPTRQVRKGTISSWKANAPGFVGKTAIEAVDRAMRGETSPSPVYEGDYGILAIHLSGRDKVCEVPLPEPDEPREAILESYPKEHSSGYHGQALIDLAFKMRPHVRNVEAIRSITIHTKHLTHLVMGSGAGDPEKWDPAASRETLDHSIMYIFAVALQDGTWHHEASYAPARAARPDTVRLWKKIQTVEDETWNRRFLEPPPLQKDHGARVVIAYSDGSTLSDELAVANAHPRGATPWQRADYVKKLASLADGLVTPAEQQRVVDLTSRIGTLAAAELSDLHPVVAPGLLTLAERDRRGIV